MIYSLSSESIADGEDYCGGGYCCGNYCDTSICSTASVSDPIGNGIHVILQKPCTQIDPNNNNSQMMLTSIAGNGE